MAHSRTINAAAGAGMGRMALGNSARRVVTAINARFDSTNAKFDGTTITFDRTT